jgi:hypothetical protein
MRLVDDLPGRVEDHQVGIVGLLEADQLLQIRFTLQDTCLEVEESSPAAAWALCPRNAGNTTCSR